MGNPQAQALLAQARSGMTTGNFPGGSRGSAAGQSPLLTQWNQQSGLTPGWASQVYAGSIGLPRSWETFRSGDFPPLEPIYPVPIDIGEGPSGRPRPRRFQFMVGWNLPVGQPGTEGVKLANFQVLRDYGEVPSPVRVCIEVCKHDMEGLNWDIVPTPDAARAQQSNPAKRKDFEKRKDEAMQFILNPDPDNYDGFDDWFNAVLEDVIVLDALAIHLQPTTGKGNGPLGSNLGALALLDGSTVRPLLNEWGARPRVPEPAYQQIIWGVPRVDLMDIINLGPDATIEDIKEINPVLEELTQSVDQWSGDQLIYFRTNPRSWTPYGFGPLEQGILPAAIILARMQWQFEFFRSGSLPSVFMDPGPTISTPEEARQLQEAINMLGGDLAAMHQVIVTPPGAKTTEQKVVDLSSDFDTWVTSLVAMPFGLSISDLGLTPKLATMMSPEAGKMAANAATDKTFRHSAIPRAKKLKAKIFDRLLQITLGQRDMEWSWGITQQGESRNDLVTQQVSLVHGSISSVDEARIALELDPYGLKETSVPLVFTPTGATVLGEIPQVVSGSKPVATSDPVTPLKEPGSDKEPPTPAHAGSQAVVSDPAESHDSADTKAVQSELATLRRYVRRHKSVSGFTTAALHKRALLAGVHLANSDPDAAVALVAKAHQHLVHRDATLGPVRQRLLDELKGLLPLVKKKKFSGFVGGATAALHRAYSSAYVAGSASASPDGTVSESARKTFDGWSRTRASSQAQWLEGVALGVAAAAIPNLMARFDLYAAGTTAAYEHGATATAMAADPKKVITWHLGDAEHCDLCIERDNQTYTEATLPGYPGDGSFGGDLCLGGPRCACWLSFDSPAGHGETLQPSLLRQLNIGQGPATTPTLEDAKQSYWAARGEFVAGLPTSVPMDELYSVQQRAMIRDAVRQEIAEEQGVGPWEVTAQQVADRLPPGVSSKPSPAELTAGKAAHTWRESKDFAMGSPLVTGFVPFDLETGVHAIYPAPVRRKKRKKGKKVAVPANESGQQTGILFAGLVVLAEDTGRVLMLQRTLEEDDGAGGTWEWPGGHLDDGETPWAAAVREWQEEVGLPLPAGRVLDMWTCPANTYEAFVYLIPTEAAIDLAGRDPSMNPDGDDFEAAAWFDPLDLPGMPSLRQEVQEQTPWSKLLAPRSTEKAAKDTAPHKGPLEHKVHDYLRKHYPDELTEWVCRSAWEKNSVPLDRIAYHNRPGGRDEQKVARMMRQIKAGKKKKRVVLIDPGSKGKMVVADGYHRLLAMEKLGITEAKAWVGTPRPGAGNWRNDVRRMQFDVENASGNEADDKSAAKSVHVKAGWRPGSKITKDSSYGQAGTEALRQWYNDGADGAISWGSSGDFDDCVAIAGQYIDDPEGYCQLRHIDATGEPSGHAPGESEAKALKAGHTGAMISLDLDPIEGVDEPHITLVYLGQNISDEIYEEACQAARELAASRGPISATIGGRGTFPPSASSDWKTPVYAIPDVPGIDEMRQAVSGLNASEHQDYKPHVTIAYVEDPAILPPPLPTKQVTIPAVSVHRGDTVQRYLFTGEG